MPLVSFHKVTKYYGDQCLLSDIDWEINPGQHIGLIGPNGVGKTTFLKLITGDVVVDTGEVTQRHNTHIGYLSQESNLTSSTSVLDEALSQFEQIHQLEKQLRYSETLLEKSRGIPTEIERHLSQYGQLEEDYEKAGGYTYRHKTLKVLHGLGFKDEDLTQQVDKLSGGGKTRLRLAKLLLGNADLLLLDEPESHLDLEATEWLEEYIVDHPAAVLVVSHDRYFLDHTVKYIAELDNRDLNTFPGNYTQAMAVKTDVLKTQQREYDKQQTLIKKNEEFIRRHIAGVKTKQAQGRRKNLKRLTLIEKPSKKPSEISLGFTSMPRSGENVVILSGISKRYGTRDLFSDMTFTLNYGKKIGIIGDNGCGKTTLLRMIVGKEKPTSGNIKLGTKINIGYYDQELSRLSQKSTVIDELYSEKPSSNEKSLRNILSRFLFRGDDVFKEVSLLSGGEKGRLMLAKLFLKEPNFLVLDEPTNHLDILSRNALEKALVEYTGTLIVASHDRYFLENMVDSLLIFESGGTISHWSGKYSEFRTFRKEQRFNNIKTQVKNLKRKPAVYNENKKELKKNKKLLEKLELLIGEKEKEITFLEGNLNDEKTFSDYAKVNLIGNTYAQAQQELKKLYLEWETTTLKIEENT